MKPRRQYNSDYLGEEERQLARDEEEMEKEETWQRFIEDVPRI